MGIFSFFSKEKKETLDKGLAKTKESVFSKIARAVAGKSKVDDEVLDNLEEVLVTSDVGVETTLKIIKRIEERVARDKYVTTEELNRILKEEIAALLTENHAVDNTTFDIPIEKKPYVIMVVGVNGVGKTTTTVNLGVGLASSGKRVLLVDADPQGSLTVSLGIKNPDELDVSLSSLMQSVIDDEPLAEGAIIRHQEGVDLLPSNIELSGMETGLFNVMSREYVLKNAIDGMRKSYDYILIDCMPSLGMMTVNALVAADSVIIPSQPNFLSTKGLNLLLRSISKIKRQINPRLKIDGILLTMVDNRTNNAKAIISSLRSTVGENIRVFRSEIPFSVRAAECSLSGESIFSHDRNGKVAAAYEALTKEVTELEERAKNRSGPDRVR